MIDDTIIDKLDKLSVKVKEIQDTLQDNPGFQTKWITKEETMRILDCSERSLQSLRDEKKLNYSNPLGGSKYFYLRKEVMALFDENFNGRKA